jgi:hypothetical protein
VDQNVSTDYEIEGLAGGERFDRRMYKANLPQSALSGPLFGQVENFFTAIDTDDGSFWAYQFGGEHGDIAGTTAQVQDPHARVYSRVAQKTPDRRRASYRCYFVQPCSDWPLAQVVPLGP